MDKKLKQTVLLAGFSVAMLTAGSSFAACMDGPYVSGNLAATWLQTQNNQILSPVLSSGGSLRLPSDTGWGGGLAVGSQNGPYRLELALDYLTNDIKNPTASAPSLPAFAIQGSRRLSATTLLINGYYDFMPQAIWTPYLGVGLGAANLNTRVSVFEPISGISARVHDDSTRFAYQGIAGASWKVASHTKASLDYRYLSTARAVFNGNDSLGDTGQLRSRYTSNRITAGLSCYFD